MLSTSALSYGYSGRPGGNRTFSLTDIALDVPQGSITGLLGPNGSGKTTLLRLLSGLLAPDRGAVVFEGRRLAELGRRDVARRMAVVPQDTHPAFDFTAFQMALMGRHPHLGPFGLEGPDDLAATEAAMRATGTLSFADRQYMTLSGGEKQRVIIAAALAQSPRLLLLDEPTASLDLGYQLEIAALLTFLNREHGVTMVLATHDLNLAASVCDRLVLLREGRTLAQGPTADVLTEAAIRQLYDVEAEVDHHQRAGRLTVTPVRKSR